MAITIRFAIKDDAKTIATIHVASWQKIYEGHIPNTILNSLSIKKREEKWFDFINQGTRIFLIEKDKQPVGFASICASRDADTNQQTCGEISAIYMHPDYWHQGLGKKLCSAALIELEKMGFSETTLWVLEENMQARKFYEAMGFSNTGKIKIDTLSACTLGVIPGEKATENTNITLKEVRYHKKFSM